MECRGNWPSIRSLTSRFLFSKVLNSSNCEEESIYLGDYFFRYCSASSFIKRWKDYNETRLFPFWTPMNKCNFKDVYVWMYNVYSRNKTLKHSVLRIDWFTSDLRLNPSHDFTKVAGLQTRRPNLKELYSHMVLSRGRWTQYPVYADRRFPTELYNYWLRCGDIPALDEAGFRTRLNCSLN